MLKKSAEEITKLYNKGVSYNQSLEPSFYDNIEKNENFYVGKQWEGVNAPDLDKPVFNFLKRVISYFVAMICSDDISISITPFDGSEENVQVCDYIKDEVENLIERQKAIKIFRGSVRDCAVDGDSAVYAFFDPAYSDGINQGTIRLEGLDNTRLIFGNPHNSDVQKQPFIIVHQRRYIDTLKTEAKENYELSQDLIDSIVADADDITTNDSSNDLVSVYFYFYKDAGTVKYQVCTKNVILKDETDLEIIDYPICYWSWDEIKNSYHGQAPITGMIPNQIFVNKLFAMCMLYVQRAGFPWIAFDKTKIMNVSNKIGQTFGVNPDITNKLMDFYKAPDFSAQILNLIKVVIDYTRDFMGANDSALGNVKPDNTSAIIALQEASAVPLEMQRRNYYQFVEDSVRAIVELMGSFYGSRKIKIKTDKGEVLEEVDFSKLKDLNYQISVDIGKSGIYDENTRITTLGNLWDRKILTDAYTFVQSIPDKMLPDKDNILRQLQEQKELQQAAQEEELKTQQLNAQAQQPLQQAHELIQGN